MANIRKGTLITEAEGGTRQQCLRWVSRKGDTQLSDLRPEQLTSDLLAGQDASVDVDFELDKHGKPQRVRRAGEVWQAPVETVPPNQPAAKPAEQPLAPNPQPKTPDVSPYGDGDFHNPYNFVPAFPREPSRLAGTGLEDHAPVGHDCYWPDFYSGKLRVRLRVETPCCCRIRLKSQCMAIATKAIPYG